MVDMKYWKIENGAVYEDTYTMRQIGGGFSISIPKRVVERKAREHGYGDDVDSFMGDFRVKAMYDNFTNIDVGYKFIRKEECD